MLTFRIHACRFAALLIALTSMVSSSFAEGAPFDSAGEEVLWEMSGSASSNPSTGTLSTSTSLANASSLSQQLFVLGPRHEDIRRSGQHAWVTKKIVAQLEPMTDYDVFVTVQ